MKKFLFTLSLLAVPFVLCSCRVNWFDTTMDAPWYVVALPVAAVLVCSYILLMNMTFVCPNCHTEFKPKWYHLMVSVHCMGKRMAKCPCCGRRGFCERKKKN